MPETHDACAATGAATGCGSAEDRLGVSRRDFVKFCSGVAATP